MGLRTASLIRASAARWPDGPATPTCHPDRRHQARGLCARCYANALRRAHYLEPEYIAARRKAGKAYHATHPAKSRQDWLKLAYGVAPEHIAEMLEAQEGLCLICKRGDLRLVVDHDHRTGLIRGLLCNSCNVGIGFLDDDPNRLMDAIAYLTRDRQGEA